MRALAPTTCSSFRLGLLASVMLLLAGCRDSKRETEKKQRSLDVARSEQKAEVAKAAAPIKTESVKLEPFWDEAGYLRLGPDQPCPEGMWALFPGEAPGADAAEKKANGAKRAELAKRLRDATFLATLKAPAEVTLKAFDAPKGVFPLDVVGTIDCTDSFGRVAIAWGTAKAVVPPSSAAKQDAEVVQNIWQATPYAFAVPEKTLAAAKEFENKHRFDLRARIVFKLGKVEVDKKIFKTTKVKSNEITIGGGSENWGAGRMVHAEVQGLRVATDQEKTVLIEKRGKP